MTLQNVRSLLWRGEDLGSGGSARELVIPPPAIPAAARPTIISRAFAGSVDISALLATTSPWATAGKNRILVNRNKQYWITVAGSNFTTNSSTSNPCSFPIPPYGMFFLPTNFGGTVTVSANSAWPIPQPLTGSPGSTVPLATALNTLTFDIVLEG